jgi:uncharacterized membrane protein YcaP (DUF421 family)
MVLITSMAIYASLILFTRLAGLRSFSKMSSFDFATTVGIGTILAGTLLNKNPPLLQGIAALAILYALQFLVAVFRQRFGLVSHIVDNEPLLLMAGKEILRDNLRRARVSEADLRAKLREANVIHLGQVRAVVFESTGDVSVLHAAPDGPPLDLDILQGVRDLERLRA